jgi:hypothetical protein
MREQRRVSRAPAPLLQRDIKGSMRLPTGRFAIDFTKTEGAAPGDNAEEHGTVTFTPAATAAESNSITRTRPAWPRSGARTAASRPGTRRRSTLH